MTTTAAPVAKPLPVREVAFVEPQVSVEDCPAGIDCGLADSAAASRLMGRSPL
jgi:hypothetical protein